MTAPAAPRPSSTSAVVGAAALVLTIVGLHHVGGSGLTAPPIRSLAAVRGWAEARDPVTVGLTIVRLLGLGLAYHLAATMIVAAAGQLLHRPALVRLAELSTPRPLRSALRRTGAVAVAITAAAAATTARPVADPASTVITASGPHPGPGSHASLDAIDPRAPVVLRGLASGPDGTATLRMVDHPLPSSDPPPPPPPPPIPAVPAVPAAPAVPAVPASEHHVVRPGDHLWSIAEATLTRVRGHEPGEAEVTAYWRLVVAANPQLADPDLLHPGEAVVVPPVPPG